MKIISFFLCCLFLFSQFNIEASVSSEDHKIYYLDVRENNKIKTVTIINRDEFKNLEKTNIDDFGNLMRIPVFITVSQKYQIGERILTRVAFKDN
ncbi:MAG: hypothetical protein ACRYGR_01110 [Janthinobacterium lividum]